MYPSRMLWQGKHSVRPVRGSAAYDAAQCPQLCKYTVGAEGGASTRAAYCTSASAGWSAFLSHFHTLPHLHVEYGHLNLSRHRPLQKQPYPLVGGKSDLVREQHVFVARRGAPALGVNVGRIAAISVLDIVYPGHRARPHNGEEILTGQQGAGVNKNLLV